MMNGHQLMLVRSIQFTQMSERILFCQNHHYSPNDYICTHSLSVYMVDVIYVGVVQMICAVV